MEAVILKKPSAFIVMISMVLGLIPAFDFPVMAASYHSDWKMWSQGASDKGE